MFLSEKKDEFGKTFPFSRQNPSGTFHFLTYLSSLFLSFLINSYRFGRGYNLGCSFASFNYFMIVNLPNYDILLLSVFSLLIFYFNFN